MTNDQQHLVKDIGEQGLLKKLQSFCVQEIVGDDGAVLEVNSHQKLVVTTDVLVDGVHFSDRTTSGFDVGWRGAAANLSDLAAMGATPIGITVGLSLPGETPVSWVEELYRGLSSCLNKYQTSIVGGDITRSSVISIAITAFGQVFPHRIIRRSHAQVGDAIAITGYHGLSRAGLELLLYPQLSQALTPNEKATLIRAHQQPQPRLDVLPLLDTIASDITIAGMDSSDGLGDAIAQICYCSKVGAVIDSEAIPLFPALTKLGTPSQAQKWIFNGGEDFELVLCLPPEIAYLLVEHLGDGAAVIGKITSQKQIVLKNHSSDLEVSLSPLTAEFQHF